MKLFLDSSNIDEITSAYETGVIDGITTNPSLIKKAVTTMHTNHETMSLKEYLGRIISLASDTVVNLEVTATTYDEMIEQAITLYQTFNPIAGNIAIKIPINPTTDDKEDHWQDGIRAIRTLSQQGIPINCTLVFTPEQALLAAKAGATYVSPFIGRINDYLRKQHDISFEKKDYFPSEGMATEKEILEDNGIASGIDLVAQIVELFKTHNIKTQVLAASIRHVREVREAALVGADIATISYATFKALFSHTLSTSGMKGFVSDTVPEYTDLEKGK